MQRITIIPPALRLRRAFARWQDIASFYPTKTALTYLSHGFADREGVPRQIPSADCTRLSLSADGTNSLFSSLTESGFDIFLMIYLSEKRMSVSN